VIALDIWDIADGIRQFVDVRYDQDFHIIVEVVRITSDLSIPQWVSLFENCAGRESKILVIGNKVDLRGGNPEDEVSSDEARAWAAE
jgi:hypothetical protein